MGFNTNLQKEIWLKHIEVQERVLQMNSAPIGIDSNSIQKIGQKLILKINEENDFEAILEKIKSFFNISNSDIDESNAILLCDSHIEIENEQLHCLDQLSHECQKYYIQLSTHPVIEGIIRSQSSSFTECIEALKRMGADYAIDSNGRLQTTVETLRELGNYDFIGDGILPETASGIFSIDPTPAYFLRKWLNVNCQHQLTKEKGHTIIHSQIILNNCFFSDYAICKLKEIWGIRFSSLHLVIEVKEETLNTVNFKNSIYDFPESDNGKFVYTFNSNTENNPNDLILQSKWQIDLLSSIFNDEFGKENVKINIQYIYRYDKKLYFKSIANIDYSVFFEDIRHQITDSNISVSMSNKSIGVDFKWKEKNVEDIKIEISNRYDDLVVSTFENHRCNIKIYNNDADWEKIESYIKENFSSLRTFLSVKDGAMHFAQEYKTQAQASQIKFSLAASLEKLRSYGCECTINPTPTGKQKYFLLIDRTKIAENKESLMKSLRGSEFSVGKSVIGKLIRVNYPEITLDTSSADSFIQDNEDFSFCQITPNLEGDLEKLSRLKTAFSRITNGKELKNKNLSEFIFDANKAKPIKSIDFYTNEASDFHKNICENLLNKHINESQLNAIIKSLLAEDISLIQGPPGTGKSTAIAELIWQHIRLNPTERILLTSETNLAVDNAIDRTINNSHNLVKPIRFGTDDRLAIEGKQFSIAAMAEWVETGKIEYMEDDEQSGEETISKRKGTVILENWLDNIWKRVDLNRIDANTSSLWKSILSNPTKEIRQLVFEEYKKHCNVVGATCSSIGELNIKNRPTKFFKDYCTLFGKVETKTISKRESDFDEEEFYEKTTYTCKDGISFTTVIQDESSKATPAELALPLIYGKKNIIIGDHRQLPPMLDKDEFTNTIDYLIENAKSESEIKKLKGLRSYVSKNFKEMEISQFQRIYESIDPSLKGEFTLQYRMHPDINQVIQQFYKDDKGLECGLPTIDVDDPDMTNPASRYHGISIEDFICGESLSPSNHVVWIDINSPEMIDGTSRVNEGEIKVISHLLNKLSASDSFKSYCNKWNKEEDKEIGIISFYSKQRNRIRQMSKSFNNLLLKIDVVDRFQGMERNIIIVSMVRSDTIISNPQQAPDFTAYGPSGYPEQCDLGFAQSPNRLNVALSRAKRLLIIIGNSALFRHKEIYDNVYNIIENNPNGKIIKCDPYEDLL